MPRVIGVIPARFASSRFPGKPLVDLAGKPMIQRVWERAARARSLSALVVATDDRQIARVVESFGGKAVMTPAACATGTDRVARAVKGMGADIVVNIQGDEPLLPPPLLDQLVSLLVKDKKAAMATLCHPLEKRDEGNPSAVKVVMDLQGRALYFSRSPIPFVRTSVPGFRLAKHVGLYAYRAAFLQRFSILKPSPLERAEGLEQLRALEHGHAVQVGWTSHPTQAVDTPADAEKVRKILLASRT
jgi:3-deoxy-manno-octulosonate cytidylyltransferase (CMP-KDO synthetase)